MRDLEQSHPSTISTLPEAGAAPDRVIYLTFDDGPTLPYTGQILEVLARYDARATFFVLGENAARHFDLIERAHAAGHGIANHTYTHPSLAGIDADSFNRELRDTAALLGDYCAAWMRPPYGAIDELTERRAADLGYSMVVWDIDPRDWSEPGADAIVERVLAEARPGAVVLLHDGGGERSQTVEALELLLLELSSQGYRFEPYCR